ncbi:hypothetical protein [Dyella choica]|nr:hypothetical protein [Dyella choica]
MAATLCNVAAHSTALHTIGSLLNRDAIFSSVGDITTAAYAAGT